jgi:hypothetical protein
MNSYYQQQVRESNFKPIGTSEAYLNFKTINHATKYNTIFQPYNLNKDIEKIYLGSLPYDHGHYNDLEHYNTYSNKNFIPPSYRVNELFPNVGVLSNIFKNR